jgi:hypothetical protein
MGTRGSISGVKAARGEAHHSPPSCAEVKYAWSYTSIPEIRLHGVVPSFKDRDNFTFTFTSKQNIVINKQTKQTEEPTFVPHILVHKIDKNIKSVYEPFTSNHTSQLLHNATDVHILKQKTASLTQGPKCYSVNSKYRRADPISLIAPYLTHYFDHFPVKNVA